MKEIRSLQHPLVKHLVKLRQNNDYRYDHGTIVIEGTKVIAEINDSETFKTLLTTSLDLIPKGAKAEETFLVTAEIIDKISGLQSSEGILAEAVMPKFSDLKGKKHLIVLDKVNDPGNLGTILRTALALGWDSVFFLDESCDPFNDKALRASRGAVFRLEMARGNWNDLHDIIVKNRLKAFVADMEGVPFNQIFLPKRVALVLGNESHGPSKEALEACTAITIPMLGQMESLNVSVAAGILLYSFRMKR